ncbi:MAG: prepilin-type N-terminal cleavage/methylation domain-containing protein [Planctomycetaceae bacterium]|nr:prepilin-type N-terminal cleavage/methylation domain-containing protein [Planctomycetaceae bacterium]
MRRVEENRQLQLRTAFTLVEMLVAVALISILMLMFAQIFSLASEILGQQRGIAANDQTERQLRTTLREDLNHRTFENVLPFESNVATTSDALRSGYFHISEGSTVDDTDDVLQLTIVRGADEDPFYGRAVELAGFPIATHPNQPEFDDQLSGTNNVGSSPYAEVAYFLRNGNLYRRITLLRNPVISANNDPTQNADGLGGNILTAPYANDFWNDFDFSGFYYDPTSTAAPNFIGANARVNDEPSTITSTITIGALSNIPVSLGIPRFRWGFDVVSGQPRFKVSDGTNEFFIGRFTQQETSDPDFDYPGSNPLTTNWMDPGTAVPAYDSANGVITDLNGGTRVSEDILLRNVHSFDIKVWDPAVSNGIDGQPGIAGFDDDNSGTADDSTELGWPGSDDGDWRDLGHSDSGSFYALATSTNPPFNFGNNNTTFGEFPNSGANGNCYDTWHPTGTAGFMPGGAAPYRPVLFDFGPDGQPGIAGTDDDGVNGIDDLNELGSALSDDVALPQPLTMIRIHIRYVDQKSDQMRDVIIVHSLTD